LASEYERQTAALELRKVPKAPSPSGPAKCGLAAFDSAHRSVVGTLLAERPVHLSIGTGEEANHAPSALVSLGKAHSFDVAR